MGELKYFKISDVDLKLHGRMDNTLDIFLKIVRKNNPTSHIVWLYGMLGYDLSLSLADAVNRYKAETGDGNVAYLQLPSTNERTVGSNGHPGYEAHKIAAEILVDYLKLRNPAG